MPSFPTWFVPLLFAVLAVLFASVARWDFRHNEGRPTPARRTFIRIAVIFTLVSLSLCFLWWLFS